MLEQKQPKDDFIGHLKENSVAAMAKGLIDQMKPTRKEDEKVSDIKKAALLLAESVKRLDD